MTTISFTFGRDDDPSDLENGTITYNDDGDSVAIGDGSRIVAGHDDRLYYRTYMTNTSKIFYNDDVPIYLHDGGHLIETEAAGRTC